MREERESLAQRGLIEVDPRGDSPFKDLRRADRNMIKQDLEDRVKRLEWAYHRAPCPTMDLDKLIEIVYRGDTAFSEILRMANIPDPNLTPMHQYYLNQSQGQVTGDPDLANLQRFYARAIEDSDSPASTPTSSPSTRGTTSLSTLMSWVPSSFSTNSDSSDQESGPSPS